MKLKMPKLKTIIKKIFSGVIFIALILFYLFFIFWIETFHYLGSGFPYLFVFLLPALLIGWRSRCSLKQTLVQGSIPPISAFLIYSIYVASFAGMMRFMGWIWDMWFLIFLYVATVLIMLYIGRFIQSRAWALNKWVVPVVSLLILFITVLQFYSPTYSNYYYMGEGLVNEMGISQNLEDKSYQETFEVLCDYLDRKYPYFEYKNIEWEKLKEETNTELKTVETDEEFHRVLTGMLSNLQDGHVQISTPEIKKHYEAYFGARFVDINGKWIAVVVYPNYSAEKIGMAQGMELIEINGKPINEALADVPDYLINAKNDTVWGQRFGDMKRLGYLLSGPSGKWPPEQPITYKRLPEGYGYIKIEYMAIDFISFVPTFDKALEELWDTNGLIIDIRGNPGGALVLTDQILGRFTDKKVKYGGILNSEGKFANLYVVPRHPTYDHPVVILIDERCASATDFFPYAASHLDGITLVGRPTKGVVSSPSKGMKLPGGAKVQLIGSGLTDSLGNYVVEWVGVQPDVFIPYNISDIQSGVDRDLLTAIEILEKGKIK
ncbi:hypothetical protein CVT91_13660 [Candidatus Atribacteria bacterium HGW-Atribacteria-1]|nr:MAG: hypothetical protein CVT91_13660 [Candidatus Atribacteria bacterium HGW-Atribacteria-1]